MRQVRVASVDGPELRYLVIATRRGVVQLLVGLVREETWGGIHRQVVLPIAQLWFDQCCVTRWGGIHRQVVPPIALIRLGLCAVARWASIRRQAVLAIALVRFGLRAVRRWASIRRQAVLAIALVQLKRCALLQCYGPELRYLVIATRRGVARDWLGLGKVLLGAASIDRWCRLLLVCNVLWGGLLIA